MFVVGIRHSPLCFFLPNTVGGMQCMQVKRYAARPLSQEPGKETAWNAASLRRLSPAVHFFCFRRSVIDVISVECGRAGSRLLGEARGEVRPGMLEIVNGSGFWRRCQVYAVSLCVKQAHGSL